MKLPITGGCSCDKVRYEIKAEPMFMGNCHCRSCQRATGAAYLPIVGVDKTAFSVTGDIKKVTVKGGSGENINRHYCASCGSFVFGEPEVLGNFLSVSASSLDDPSLYQPQMNIWTEDAQPWDLMDKDLPAFKQNPKM